MMIRALTSTGAVIDALGGTGAVAKLVGRSPQLVSGWRAEGRLPAYTWLILNAALEQAGCEAPPGLWDFLPVPPLAGDQAQPQPHRNLAGAGSAATSEPAPGDGQDKPSLSRVTATHANGEGEHV